MTAARTLDWTFELPAAGDGATGLEDYLVEDARGARVGKVATVLRHGDGLFLALERGTPPLTHELAAVPWHAVRDVDHDALTVRLALAPDEVESAPRLDHSRKVEQEEADAIRVTEVPGPPVRPEPVGGGPVDRPAYAVPVWAGVLGVFGMLVLAIFATGFDFGWEFVLFAIPGALLVFAAVAAYRIFRNPYSRG